MIFLFLQYVSSVIIVYIIISPLNSYLYIHWMDIRLKINIIIIINVKCYICSVVASKIGLPNFTF